MPRIKPNILFIVLDTHRVDRLGCYGYSRGTSPNLDKLANSATLFERAISPAQWTIPSHASMFSGEFPSTHLTVQASSMLSPDFTTLAEHLSHEGYNTTGFCNNPLVGVLENGLRRGFDNFYNYGGAIQSKPMENGNLPLKALKGIRDGYQKVIERVAVPIQQAVAGSPAVFQFILNPRLVSLWTRYANFKGNGPSSIKDTLDYLQRNTRENQKPQFVFLNLMGTHLPYTPPERFIKEFAPIITENPEAANFMRDYNTRAFHWLLPMKEPYTKLEARTLSDMYDAEVAYQDHLLGQLLDTLDKPEIRQDTMVIVVGDHGEMLGEHNLMGHGLGLYQELIHVPLIIRFPGQEQGKRVTEPVSTTYVYHTALESAGIEETNPVYSEAIKTGLYSLKSNSINEKRVFSEGYPPMNLIKIIEKQEPAIMDEFNCEAVHWAIFEDMYKLLRVDSVRDELFNLAEDPQELQNLANDLDRKGELGAALDACLTWATSRSPEILSGHPGNLYDEEVQERMRALGYIE